MVQLLRIGLLGLCMAALSAPSALAQESKQTEKKTEDKKPPAGHSYHGEAFNEGPRQQAYLIGGTGKVHFPVKSKHAEVQKFIEQGVGQLHGFWYFEAERTFREAARIDPNCAIAYWGMAKANRYNNKRAKSFIAEAVKRKSHAGPRERMYIDSLNAYLTSKGNRSKKAQAYAKAISNIAKKYPDDLEAEALLGYLYYINRTNLKKKHAEVDKQLKKVLAREPMHPVHHFVIHTWDYKDPKKALASSALCGQSAPEIAHMWHMPGHIYSRLKRYPDAVWQQEASARVDHKHMIHDRVLPDQIHNFAHNNEWLIRNLMYIGRWRAALDLAKNMTELPRHPKYNTLTKRRSANYGRQRMFEVLHRYELWAELIALSKTTYLEPTTIENEQIKHLRHLGIAYFRTGDNDNGEKVLQELQSRLKAAQKKANKRSPRKNKKTKDDTENTSSKTAGKTKSDTKKNDINKKDKPTTAGKKNSPQKKGGKRKPKRPTKSANRNLQQAISALQGHRALARKDYNEAYSLLRKSGEEAVVLARAQCLAGENEAAIKAAQRLVNSGKNQVLPLAALVEICSQAGKMQEAKKAFDQLRRISGHIQFGSPVFDRLAPIAKECGCSGDWRIAAKASTDVGKRPDLDDLGPFRWQPSPALNWALEDAWGKVHSLKQYRGKPVIVIFFLGYGCLHCAEQIEAFAPMTKTFEKAGISLIAISTDDREGLRISHKNYKKGPFPFPLIANKEMNVFKAYRAFDDFENVPLHGTFLIDETGLVRWQDISYEPFMDVNFVLRESQRLLGLK